MSTQHDASQAIRFLRLLYPDGPWVLTSIAVDKLGITTRTFRPDDEGALASFLQANADRNIYYSLNRPTRDLTQKADKTEIDRVCYLHVDVDPRTPDLDLDEGGKIAHNLKERERILGLLKTPPDPIPQPTACVFSGGGYQGLWLLADPVTIEGTTKEERWASAADVERYNLALEWAMQGAPQCFNVDRIMRLPGTWNIPDAKKRAKGRQRTQAKLEWFNEDAPLPLASFTPANHVQPRNTSAFSLTSPGGHKKTSVAVPSNTRRYTTDELHEMYPNVKKHAWVVCVQGRDPDKEERHDGRSEWLFYACCEMVRGNVPDDVIYSVITDPDFLISASVLDKGGQMQRYALRQIERAKENAINPALRELNERHAVVENFGGRCRVIEMIEDPVLKREALTIQSFGDFSNRYMNRRVQIGVDKANRPIEVPMGRWWLEHEHRRQYRAIVFAPQHDVPGAFNLWQGFGVEARPGSAHQGFLDHCMKNLCSNNAEIFKYLIGWMATAVQHPARPGHVAVVFRGMRGTGKGFFAKTYGALFGRHYLHVANASHLVGHFNAQLRDAVVVFADEAFFAGDKKHESVLKTLITEESLIIERKGIDAETSANYVHLIMASNDDWVVPVGHNERRFLVLDVDPAMMQNTAYFGALDNELQRGGLSNLLYYLQHYDLSGFDVRKVPRTAALRDQLVRSLASTDEWWLRKLEEGILLPDHAGWQEPVLKEQLIEDYLQYTQRVGNRRSTATVLGKFLHKAIGGALREFQAPLEFFDPVSREKRKERRHFYELPPLDKCRKSFEDAGLGEYPWPSIEVRGAMVQQRSSSDEASPF